MKNKLIILFVLIFLTFSGCISEYHAKGIDELKNLLVVEGTISEGTTTIKLSRSVGLYDNAADSERVKNAQVSVEAEDGKVYYANGGVGGIYTIDIDRLDPDTKYRLKIMLDNNQYESTFSKPILTPEIDKIFWTKDSGKEIANISVSTRGGSDQPRYYNWSYKEVWEIKADLYSNFMIDERGNMIFYDENEGPFNLKYYCWVHKNSNSFILASSDKLSENVISEKKLVVTTPFDDRFSELYYIKVTQNMLSKEAYDYFTNLQKNIESTGSIFSPIPSEMKGNIYCVNDPDIPVIGYVEVSNTKEKQLYIYRKDGLHEYKYNGCVAVTEDEEMYDPNSMEKFYHDRSLMGAKHMYAYPRCFDCTFRGGKDKPDFWPNDHK